jgi:hypothetical protein
MKKTMIVFALVLALATSSSFADSSVGSSFGTLTTAKALGQGHGTFGFGVGLADYTSFVGTFAYGLSQYSDGRLKLGFVDPGPGDAEITLGADYKWQFWNVSPSSKNPFDFAVGMAMEYVSFSYESVFQLGGQLIGSYPVALKNGGTLTPYGRFNARVEWISWDLPPTSSRDDSESNLEVGLNGGVQWQMTSTVALYTEFQIDGNDGIFIGIDFGVM